MDIYTTAPRSLDYPDTVCHGRVAVMGRKRDIEVRHVTGTQKQQSLYLAVFSKDCSDFHLASTAGGFRWLRKLRIVFGAK